MNLILVFGIVYINISRLQILVTKQNPLSRKAKGVMPVKQGIQKVGGNCYAYQPAHLCPFMVARAV